ncbi:hypothetical protein QCM77_44215 [Bradyrhizobium sp. SSUT18]|uniref:hypothetical protein n=1 Tax=Bradyrhizobium sp. SSUT18 TaxID=3040602 RepID=UPI00244769D0|nr:hypothetical protein [Bradyrhizobium sp. SSUT18]MDH2406791.1 hypothetical protein [Bradyrhizobium sp. SSUT18]
MNEPDAKFTVESDRDVMPKKKQHIDLSDPNLSSLILRLAIPSVVGLSIRAGSANLNRSISGVSA